MYLYLLTALLIACAHTQSHTAALDSVFVVGSLDEALNIRGFRYHPADIEATVARCHKSVIAR